MASSVWAPRWPLKSSRWSLAAYAFQASSLSPALTLSPAFGLSLASSATASRPSPAAPSSPSLRGMEARTSHCWTNPSESVPAFSSATAADAPINSATVNNPDVIRIGSPPCAGPETGGGWAGGLEQTCGARVRPGGNDNRLGSGVQEPALFDKQPGVSAVFKSRYCLLMGGPTPLSFFRPPRPLQNLDVSSTWQPMMCLACGLAARFEARARSPWQPASMSHLEARYGRRMERPRWRS